MSMTQVFCSSLRGCLCRAAAVPNAHSVDKKLDMLLRRGTHSDQSDKPTTIKIQETRGGADPEMALDTVDSPADFAASTNVWRERGLLSQYTSRRVQELIERRQLQQPAATTLAELVPYSYELQSLLAIGVSLKELEKYSEAIDIVTNRPYLNGMRDVVTLLEQLGIQDVAAVINKHPLILGLEVEVIRKCLLYLSGRRFTPSQICEIVTRCPKWLCEPIEEVDAKLGAIQKVFKLTAGDLRKAATKCPKLIFTSAVSLQESRFIFKEIYRFSPLQQKRIITTCPSVHTVDRHSLEERLDLLLNEMSITRDQICHWPLILRCRQKIIRERHGILTILGRNIYDDTTPGYISLQTLVSGSVEKFSTTVAHITPERYNEYLKTL